MSNGSIVKLYDKVKFFDKVKILPGGVSSNSNPSPAPTYSLSRSSASVDEGSSITFTLTTTDVANGTSIPYTISGISAGDLSSGSLTGNFVVNNGSATVTVTLASDALTDGSETISITAAGQSTSSSVNDTSLTPIYSLSRSAASVDEGSSITFTLTTTNVANGTSVPYTISGISAGDLSSGSLSGNFVVNNGSAEVTVTLAADALTDGSETISITAAGQSSSASVNDTSLTPTYTLSRSAASVDEGSSITFTLSTTNVANGTNIPYAISGISAGDLSSGSLTGNFIVNNGSATVTLNIANDSTTEGSETITIVAAGQSSGASVNDTSVFVTSTYTLSRSTASINEGSSVTFTLTTTGVADGTSVPYTITGISAGDLSSGSLSGDFVISNGSATVTLTAANDLLSEGYETITIEAAGQTSASTINDTSVTIPLTSTYVTRAIGFPIPDLYTSTSNLYAISNDNKLYKSQNMGSTWTMLTQLTARTGGENDARTIFVSPDETRIGPGSFARGYTIDGGVTWSAGNVPTTYPVGVDANLTVYTYVVKDLSNTLYRIQRRPIFGATFQGSSIVGPNLSKWSAICTSGNGLVSYASTLTALYKSVDAGATWNLIANPGFTGISNLWCSYDGSRVYAQNSSSTLFRSDDEGSSWTNVSPGGAYLSWGGFSRDGSTILFGRSNLSTPSRSLYLSQNSGASWSLLTDVFPTKIVSGSTTDDSVMHAYVNFDGTKFAIRTNFYGRIFVSEDSGATWSQKYLP